MIKNIFKLITFIVSFIISCVLMKFSCNKIINFINYILVSIFNISLDKINIYTVGVYVICGVLLVYFYFKMGIKKTINKIYENFIYDIAFFGIIIPILASICNLILVAGVNIMNIATKYLKNAIGSELTYILLILIVALIILIRGFYLFEILKILLIPVVIINLALYIIKYIFGDIIVRNVTVGLIFIMIVSIIGLIINKIYKSKLEKL